jgi:hypothetical protein
MKSFVKLFFCLFLLTPVLSLAELPKQVELDYAVLKGYVVMPISDEYIVDLDASDNMPISDEYIVDLDASDNLHVGDILTLVTPGQKILHPETREILGTVDIPIGYLQVTRLNSGYSYATLLSEGVAPRNGDHIRRFEQVPALFVDNKGDDGAFASQFMTELPQFKWLQAGDKDQPLLTFTLKAETLVVKTSEGHLLHSYAISDNQQLVTKAEPVRRSYVSKTAEPKRSPLQTATNSLLGVLNLADDDSFSPENVGIIRQSAQSKRGVWMGPNLDGNPAGVAVADFDGDGLQEIAVALNNKLLISQNNQGEYIEKADVPIPSWLKILSMDTLDLDSNSHPELYLTAIVGKRLASFVVMYNGSDYDIVIDKVEWYLRAVELVDQKRVLIGQAMRNDKESFQGKPFYVHLEENRLVKGEEIDLPGLINMYSFVPFTDKENQLYYAYLTDGDYLKVVNAAGVEMWESGEYYGGSESCFENRKGHEGETVLPTCIRSRLIKTEDNEILVAQNVGQRLMQRWRKYKESRLLSLNWNGFAMEENWRTASQQGYLGDFSFADADNDGKNEVVMAVKFKHKGYITKPRAAVVLYDLD